MLESIDIIIDMVNSKSRSNDLIEKLSEKNYDGVEFTVHVENMNLRMKLLHQLRIMQFDSTMVVEHFLSSIERILNRNGLRYSVIEHLTLNEPIELHGLEL